MNWNPFLRKRVKSLPINRCLCGNPFPGSFSGAWERADRDGRIFARCLNSACRREVEAFSNGGSRYWIWPSPAEDLDNTAV